MKVKGQVEVRRQVGADGQAGAKCPVEVKVQVEVLVGVQAEAELPINLSAHCTVQVKLWVQLQRPPESQSDIHAEFKFEVRAQWQPGYESKKNEQGWLRQEENTRHHLDRQSRPLRARVRKLWRL